MQSAAICQRTCNVFPPARSRPLASASNEIPSPASFYTASRMTTLLEILPFHLFIKLLVGRAICYLQRIG